MNRFYIYSLVFLAVIIGVIVLLNFPSTEFVRSADSILLVEGRTESLVDMSVDEYPIVAVDNLSMVAYEISRPSGYLEEPVTLYFDLREEEDTDNTIIYQLIEEYDMWVPVGGSMDRGILSYDTQTLGWYTIGGAQDVGLLDFTSDLDEILELAPEGAVGFQVLLGYKTADMHDTILDPMIFEGGCAGVVDVLGEFEASRIEKPSSVFVNGVQADVTFIFVVEWFVQDGCIEGESLELTF